MNNKDAIIIKALAELGLRKEPELNDAELEMLKRAQNPEDFFLDDVEKLFKETQ
jgi:hypothetical protein